MGSEIERNDTTNNLNDNFIYDQIKMCILYYYLRQLQSSQVLQMAFL